MSVGWPAGDRLLNFFYSGIQLYILMSPYPFISRFVLIRI